MNRLLLLRQAYNLTRAELSDITGLSTIAIIRYEGQELYGTYDKLSIFSELYGTTIDFILERTKFPYNFEYVMNNPEAARICYKKVEEMNSDYEIINNFLPPTKNERLKEAIEKKRCLEGAIISPHTVNNELSTLSFEDQARVIELIAALKAGEY